MSLFIAELETRHFSFRAVGSSEDDARKTMKKAWRKHAKQYGPNVAPFSDYEDGVNVWEASLGTMLRDLS